MTNLRVADAARNNAAWCNAVCSAHGSPGEFYATHWLSRGAAPPGYPNLVTLEPSPEPAMAAVRELAELRPDTSLAVKDSFAVLALESAGFRVLFDAEWILRPAHLCPLPSHAPGVRLLPVRSASALSAWEDAWGESRGGARVFLPSLLQRSDVAFLAALDAEDRVVAGAVANRSENAVGISNFFARDEPRRSLRAACVDAIIRQFPGLCLVGYEAGDDLAETLSLGFEPLGPLRVWVHETERDSVIGPGRVDP